MFLTCLAEILNLGNFTKSPPKTAHIKADRQADCAKQLLFTLLFHFCSKDFDIFSEYFLKWMWNLSFLTSITYSLTPSLLNLVRVEARWLMVRFTWRSNEIWGCEVACNFFRLLLFRSLWLVERTMYNQSGALSHTALVSQQPKSTETESQRCILTDEKWIENISRAQSSNYLNLIFFI